MNVKVSSWCWWVITIYLSKLTDKLIFGKSILQFLPEYIINSIIVLIWKSDWAFGSPTFINIIISFTFYLVLLILNLLLQLFLSLSCCERLCCFLYLKVTCLKLADLPMLMVNLAASVLTVLLDAIIICVWLISLLIVFQ